MRWPKYAAHLLMKYYVSKTNPHETFVLVHYAGEVSHSIREQNNSSSIIVFSASNLTEL